MLQIELTTEQQVTVTVSPKTPAGNPAKLDGMPAWTVIDGNSTCQVAEDGLSALIISSDQPGLTHIQVQADADLGEGVETITDTIEVTVVDPQASSLGLEAGSPTEKPSATTPPPSGGGTSGTAGTAGRSAPSRK